MKWLINEGALQFESKEELMWVIKMAHDLFDLASSVAKTRNNMQNTDANSQKTDDNAQKNDDLPPQPAQAAVNTQPMASMQQALNAPIPPAQPAQPQPVQATPQPVQAAAQPQAPQPVQAAAQPQPVQTAAQPQAEPAAIPTATPQFSIEELQKAARPIIDAGGQPALTALLGEFGVMGISQLSPQQIGPFATRLREMGGKI